MFGIRPNGFHTFSLTPQLPKEWASMALRKINICNHSFDIEVQREKEKLSIKIVNGNEILLESIIDNGEKIEVQL
jgi:hypothetical protein